MPPPAGVGGGIAASTVRVAPTLLKRGRPRIADRIFGTGVSITGVIVLVVIAAMVVFLVLQGLPAMQHYGFFSFITASRWTPSTAFPNVSHPNPYGILQFIYGTMLTSIIGMIIAVPLAVGAALVITEVAPQRIKGPLSGLVDLLAAVPSVVYGFWGIFALIPAIKPVVDFLTTTLGTVPVIGVAFQGPFFGVSYFSAGLVLAIMVLPIIAAVCREVFRSTPRNEKEAALALGRDALGDDPHRGAPACAFGHRRGVAARSWPRFGRDDRGHHGDRQRGAAHQRKHLLAGGDDVQRHRQRVH